MKAYGPLYEVSIAKLAINANTCVYILLMPILGSHQSIHAWTFIPMDATTWTD